MVFVEEWEGTQCPKEGDGQQRAGEGRLDL